MFRSVHTATVLYFANSPCSTVLGSEFVYLGNNLDRRITKTVLSEESKMELHWTWKEACTYYNKQLNNFGGTAGEQFIKRQNLDGSIDTRYFRSKGKMHLNISEADTLQREIHQIYLTINFGTCRLPSTNLHAVQKWREKYKLLHPAFEGSLKVIHNK